MEQLDVYHHMLQGKDDAEYDRIYQRWLKERFTGEWWTVSQSQAVRTLLKINADTWSVVIVGQEIQRKQALIELIDL